MHSTPIPPILPYSKIETKWPSIFTIGNNSVFLNPDVETITAGRDTNELGQSQYHRLCTWKA